jgi:prepilin-type N-terminal cleavage/methylation domain-containing protein
MLNKLKKSNSEGFTIIEVMIVLAIAGLIMLVVFLAVPTLQRNQRNSGRRADASRIASAANDFVTNGNGAVPETAGNATTVLDSAGTLSNMGTLTGGGAASAPATACAAGTFVATKLTVCGGAAIAAFTAPTADGAILAVRAQCSGSSGVAVGSSRQMAVLYAVEGGSNWSWACINI